MSLIQEALRRHQEESEKNPDVGATPPVQLPAAEKPKGKILRRIGDKTQKPAPEEGPPVQLPPPIQPPPSQEEPPALSSPEEPPPLPPEDGAVPAAESAVEAPDETQQAVRQSRSPLVKLIAIAAGALIMLGIGVWAIIFAIKQFKSPAPAPAEPPPATIPVGTTQPESVEPPKPPDAEPAEIPVEPSSGSAVTPVPAVEKKPPVVVAPPPPPEPPPPPPEPVVWPFLTLNGIVGKGKDGSAMINGEIVAVGEKISDVTVISISNQGVTLEYQGETMFLKIRGTTAQ